MTLRNRFVRSATNESLAADDGFSTPELRDFLVSLAEGGVGLIITGHAYVSPEGKAGPGQLGVYSDFLLPGLTSLARGVHDAGGRILLQLAHAGCFASARQEARGPSPVEMEEGQVLGREMTEEEIRQVVLAFGRAAERAMHAGFDGVQIHAAHGYLLSQFLSPFFNRREDRYGGNVENRTRIIQEVIGSIRYYAGNEFPVIIKINSEDYIEGGLTVDGMLEAVAILENLGLDAVELSGGTAHPLSRESPIRKYTPESPEEEGYYREAARRYREKISLPLMLVGGIRSYEISESLVREGLADYISLARPLIREPALINRWKSGDRAPATCISCNRCLTETWGSGLHCVLDED